MLTLKQIIYTSFKSTSSRVRWWIFALVQIIALVFIGSLTKNDIFFRPGLFWLICGCLIIQPVTVGLWLEIEAHILNKPKNLLAKDFLNKCLNCLFLTIVSVILVFIVRLIYPTWIVTSFFSSLIAATCVLSSLYVVLCDQSFFSALALAFDTWHRKISMACVCAGVIILGHSVAFVLAHKIFTNNEFKSFSFASFNHSATIWLLVILMGFVLSFFAAVANSFLVSLFLSIIQRKKDPIVKKVNLPNLTAINTSI
jgi:hypothetical protein